MLRASKVENAIREIVEEAIDPEGPGVAILVVGEGEVLHKAGYGVRKLGGEALTSASVFDLASVSKHITGTAIALLAERGSLSIDDPVKKHVPRLAIADSGRAILIRDLLWHVSGLPDYTSDAWEGEDEEFTDLSNQGLVTWLNTKDMESEPGVEYVYNNSGYALLARVVEEITGQSYAAFVEASLFGPLGMTHTVALDSLTRKLKGRVTGYKDGDDEWVESLVPSIIQGDGNVFTCLDDLVLWDAAMRDHTLLSEESLQRCWTPGTLDDGSAIENDSGYGYGFGWNIDASDASIFHDGSWSGTATSILRYIDADCTIAVLSNNEDTGVEDLSVAIAAALEG